MKELFVTETRARLRTWLAIGYALFIVYASLSPFSGWREQGLDFLEVLDAPLLLTYTAFDAVVNLLSYLPFGLLAGLALHARFGAAASVILGLCLGVSLSAGMEYLQMYLPARISSNMDLLSNSVGALIGVLLAVSVASWTWLFSRLTHWRSGLFHHGHEMDFVLADAGQCVHQRGGAPAVCRAAARTVRLVGKRCRHVESVDARYAAADPVA